MRSVIRRRLAAPARSGDRGAIGILVGILIGGGVLLGISALVIDVGLIYHERAQLQNAADAGALAVAKGCALGNADCSADTGTGGTARPYADANSKDVASAVELVCGSDPDAVLPGCPESTGAITECPVETPEGDYAEVRTSTLETDGTTLLPSVFARALLGNESYEGKNVRACARAAWGAPSAANGLALTVSWCEWNAATGGGADYAPPPPDLADPSYERVLVLRAPGSGSSKNPAPTCEAEPSGADIPGGFGWTADDPADPGSCTTHFETDGTYAPDTGGDVPSRCKDVLLEAYNNYPTALIIPVYTGHPDGQGSNGEYTLWQPAAFVVTGWSGLAAMEGGDRSVPSKLTGRTRCANPGDSCLFGYFTTGVTSGTIGGGSGAGVSVVKLTG